MKKQIQIPVCSIGKLTAIVLRWMGFDSLGGIQNTYHENSVHHSNFCQRVLQPARRVARLAVVNLNKGKTDW